MRTTALVVAAAMVAAGLAACMQVDQTATPVRQGKYQGKPDTAPWDDDPVAGGPKWTKGDRTSWEDQIKKRQLAQNENQRINQ